MMGILELYIYFLGGIEMKKSFIVSAALIGTMGFSGMAFAAANPFDSVPRDHWAYPAVQKLVHDGLVDGYGDKLK